MQDFSPRIVDLRRRLAEAALYLRVDERRDRLPQLETELGRPDLWDDAESAKAVQREFAALSDDLGIYDRLASGIDDNRVVLIVWLMAGAMAGLSGVMLGSTEFIGWNMGQRVLLVMFAAVLLGGLGTTFGAMFGGLFVGIVSDLSTLWLDADLKIVVALATLVAVLLVRPQGVFGVKARTA